MKKKNKLLGAVIALGAALGIIVNGTFGSPADMIADLRGNKAAIVTEIADEPDGGVQDSDEGNDEEEEKKEKGGFFSGFRRWLLRLPKWVRAIFGIPLWAIGHLLVRGITKLLSAVLAPLLLALLKWLLFALILLFVFAVIMKLLFPDMPLRTILSRRNVTGITLCSAMLFVFAAVLPRAVPEFREYVFITEFTGGILILVIFGILTWQDDRKAYKVA